MKFVPTEYHTLYFHTERLLKISSLLRFKVLAVLMMGLWFGNYKQLTDHASGSLTASYYQ